MPKVSRQEPVTAKKSGIVGKIKPDTQVACGVKICLYGRSGSGKTTLAGTFPKPLLRIRSPNEARRKSVLIKGADVADPLSLSDLKELAEHQRATKKYATIVLDNVTDFQDMCLKEVLKVDEIPAQMGWGVATQSQWGEIGMAMKEMLRSYISNLDCHIVVIAQEREFNTESTNEVLSPYVNCALSPSIAGWVGPSVDFLCQCFLRMDAIPTKKKIGGKEVTINKEVVGFHLRTGPHPVFSTKFTVLQGTKVPDSIPNPSYNKILSAIAGE